MAHGKDQGAINRYYSGVYACWTTRCCSAIALTLLFQGAISAKAPEPPPSFFPARTVWTLALNNALTAPPAYDDGRGFFAIEGNRVVAYDLASGRQLWLIPGSPRSQPATGDGLLFLADTEAITAVRQADGTTAWHLPFGEPLAAPLVWDNGWLIASNKSGMVTAFRATDGRLIWRRDIDAEIHAQPALAADRVYLPAADGRVVALKVDTGALLWEHRLGGAAGDILALDDRIFVGSSDNFFYAIGARKGEILWRWRTGGDIVGRAAIDERHVYFISLDNVLRGMDRRSGDQVWKRALPARATTGPLLAGTSIIVSGREPGLHVYAGKDGAPGTDVKTDSVVAMPAAVVRVPAAAELFLIFVTSDLVKGATVVALTRSIDPPVAATISPLPNPIKPVAAQNDQPLVRP
jgi:outer membrane protein assembly factor BamB